MGSVAAAFAAALETLGGVRLWPVAVAVSGGSDSLALMGLLAEYAAVHTLPPPAVVTVDHALQDGSRRVALQTARRARSAGLSCRILTRTGPVPAADIEAVAREARYRLIGAWAVRQKIATVFLAHTLDDQAETFLMRLMRGSGVDGLSAMRPLSPFPVPGFDALRLARPLLRLSREDLRRFLIERGQGWHDDPMNEDDRFTRVRLRQAWPQLAALGFKRERLADAADHLARARDALEADADALQHRAVRHVDGKLLLDTGLLVAAPEETGLRLLARLLMAVSGAAYRPRFDRLQRVYGAIVRGDLVKGVTLHGCKIARAPARYAPQDQKFLLISAESAARRQG